MMEMTNNEKPIGVVSIKQKNKHYIVTFSNDEEFLMDLNIMLENRISLDKRYTEDEFEKLKKDVDINKFLEKAINHLSYKVRTKKEMIDYLKGLKLSTDDINLIMDKLIKYGYINDELYIELYRRECLNQLKGERFFKYSLKQKGIESDNLSYNELEPIDNLVNKYQKIEISLRENPIIIQKRKIQQRLQTAGFSSKSIDIILSKIEFMEDLDNKLNKEIEKITKKTGDYNKQVTYLLSKGYKYSLIKEKLRGEQNEE